MHIPNVIREGIGASSWYTNKKEPIKRTVTTLVLLEDAMFLLICVFFEFRGTKGFLRNYMFVLQVYFQGKHCSVFSTLYSAVATIGSNSNKSLMKS